MRRGEHKIPTITVLGAIDVGRRLTIQGLDRMASREASTTSTSPSRAIGTGANRRQRCRELNGVGGITHAAFVDGSVSDATGSVRPTRQSREAAASLRARAHRARIFATGLLK